MMMAPFAIATIKMALKNASHIRSNPFNLIQYSQHHRSHAVHMPWCFKIQLYHINVPVSVQYNLDWHWHHRGDMLYVRLL
jgi:hypothetical protein